MKRDKQQAEEIIQEMFFFIPLQESDGNKATECALVRAKYCAAVAAKEVIAALPLNQTELISRWQRIKDHIEKFKP